MSGLPAHIREEIAEHLNAIGALFKNPRVTLVVRIPDLDDGDLVMTQDDPELVIGAIRRLAERGPNG